MIAEKIRVQDIDGSLNYGQVFSSKAWRNSFIFIYVFLGIAAALCIAAAIGIPLTIGEFDNEAIAMIVALCFICLIAISMGLVHAFFNKGKKNAKLWLEDAIILEAYAMPMGQALHVRNLIMRTATALEVSFEYDNKCYIKQSTYKDKPLYLALFTKYADKKILIAYSPKYDEVMLIKPESAKRYKENNDM